MAALRAIVPADQIGEGHRVRADGELLVTHLFPATARGARGWEWYVTLTRVPGSEEATVCESGMLPGEDALLAPAWVPWSERVLDTDHEDDEHDDRDHEDAAHEGAEQEDPDSDDPNSGDSQRRRADHEASEDGSADRAGSDAQEAAGIDPAL